ncbi:DinB family protein [Salinibacterium sp. SYSU T00001]|uniref:mycothiol transferase n=1 Tax=Homoserinimonas sedimenticola TaxID=2986805 RepID=UPI00223612DF|nr:DinB family protein [Salinibacterium sedimenticola]MCW4386166.1 DinB family protein [Salinibacterium sedimenticola]
MSTATDLLADHFERIRETVRQTTGGLTPEQLTHRVDAESNTIAWLIWHLTRVQDDHIADVMGAEQIWATKGWADAFGLPFDASATGYGQTPDEVAAVQGVTAEELIGYHEDVAARTLDYVRGLSDDDLARIVDENWVPPVTLAVRLVSVIGDDLQHVGQAGFIRGIVERR